jgi:hypothetical protein
MKMINDKEDDSVDLDESNRFTNEDLEALQSLQNGFQKCVSANGLGLQAAMGRDYCKVSINFPKDTVPKWVNSLF